MLLRRVIVSIAPLAAAALLASCAERGPHQAELAGASMGTTWSVKVVAPPADVDIESLQADVDRVVSAVEQSMSTYLPDSDVSQFNRSASTGWVGVPPEFCAAVDDALAIGRATDGAFDVTVGPLVNLWGFGPDGLTGEPPSDEHIDAALASTGHARLDADCSRPALRKELPGLYVDLSAYAKGYAVDRVAELLDARSIANYLVEIGGELRMRGLNARGDRWAIAVEKPVSATRAVQSVIRLSEAAVATSGDYRNFFEYDGVRYSHTIDPRTGRPVAHGAASVTVVAQESAYADAIATALLVMGPCDGLEFADRENIAAYFLVRDGDAIEERASSRFLNEVAQ